MSNETASPGSETVVHVASKIAGVGKCVPDRVIDNNYFASYLETSDEWIKDRTGIAERRWAPEGMTLSDIAEPACRQAIESAGLVPEQIDAIVCATVTPDFTFPSLACVLQNRLGIPGCPAFDVNAVCSGFIYALMTGDSLVRSGRYRNVLVIGADMFSRIVNPNERAVCVLFGDGAGAVVLSSVDNPDTQSLNLGMRIASGSPKSLQGIYGFDLHADGSQGELLKLPIGTALPATPESLAAGKHYVVMHGKEVFKLAVRGLAEAMLTVLRQAGLTLDDVDHFVSHQANGRILQGVAKYLEVTEDRIPMNVHKYGNTSAASVPLLFAESVQEGRIKRGDLCALSAFGAGLTWGAVLLRY